MSEEFCPECGAKITGKTGFCSECGAATQFKQKENKKIVEEIKNTNLRKEKKSKKYLILGVVFAIISYFYIIVGFSFKGYIILLFFVLSVVMSILTIKDKNKYYKFGIYLLLALIPIFIRLILWLI